MGAEWVGPDGMVATAEAFGFNSDVGIDLPGAADSRFPTDYGAPLADVDVAAFLADGELKKAKGQEGDVQEGDAPSERKRMTGPRKFIETCDKF